MRRPKRATTWSAPSGRTGRTRSSARFASKIVNKVAQKATGVKMRDYGCMLRAYRRHIVDAMLQCNERSTFIPVLGNSFARNTCEIPVRHNERAVGDSKYSLWKLINLQFNLLTCMTTMPLRILTYFGLFAAFCGYLLSVYIVVRRFLWDDGDSWGQGGVFTLFAVMFIFTGIQMIGIGMIGEYIGRIYNDVRARRVTSLRKFSVAAKKNKGRRKPHPERENAGMPRRVPPALRPAPAPPGSARSGSVRLFPGPGLTGSGSDAILHLWFVYGLN